MASKQSNVDFILEQLSDTGDVSARKMFGEYAIYCRGKIVALFCDDQLFVKPTDAGRAFIGKVSQVKEGSPYPGAKPWFAIGGDHCEDGEWLSELVRITERALPPPKPKSPKKTKVVARAKAKAPALRKAPAKTKTAPRSKPQRPTKKRARRS